ncbi:MAG: DUF4097 domain-containing protein [Clostridia bacterium]|nr:DUF4097 domain-containing protein [Clostridia bacterium]
MTNVQKVIKYLAMAFAIFLTVTIITAICTAVISVFGVIGIINNVNEAKNVIDYSNSFTDVKSLDIEVSTCELNIMISNRFYVEASNVPEKFTCENVNGKLEIRENESKSLFGSAFSYTSNSKITVYIPSDFTFETAYIKTGVGRTNIEALASEKLNIENGVGELICQGLEANNSSINAGVGKISIDNAILNDLDLDSGVGSLKISGILTGNTKLNCGIGKVDVSIDANKADYQIIADSGIGAIKIDGQNYTENTPTDSVIRKDKLNINGGIGEVVINFKK